MKVRFLQTISSLRFGDYKRGDVVEVDEEKGKLLVFLRFAEKIKEKNAGEKKSAKKRKEVNGDG